MATHSSVLAWKILWRDEPSGLQSIMLQSQTWLSIHTHTNTDNFLLISLKSNLSKRDFLFVTEKYIRIPTYNMYVWNYRNSKLFKIFLTHVLTYSYLSCNIRYSKKHRSKWWDRHIDCAHECLRDIK